MMEWILTNISTIAVSLLLMCFVTLVIVKMVKDKKKGITSCGTSCSGCAMAGSCKEIQKKEKRGSSEVTDD